jgi:transposase
MLHLGIDLHQYQITTRLLDDAGRVLRRATVPTAPPAIDQFLASVNAMAKSSGGYRAIIESCGFEHWLIEKLKIHECAMTILVQPLKRARHKTDKRDAASLAELLWINRERLRSGQRIHGIRQVLIPSESDRQDRMLTNQAVEIRRQQTRVINQAKAILRRFNLMHDCPTKGFKTKRARAWLRTLELPEVDRLVLDLAIERWELIDQQLARIQLEVERRAEQNSAAQVLNTIPGVADLTALALASRIGPIERFPRPASLANMFGLTPSINDSGETTGRLGRITKNGHPNVRYLLGHVVFHLVKKDRTIREAYRKLRKRRGPKIAMVAIMRRITCRIWHMLHTGEAYRVT